MSKKQNKSERDAAIAWGKEQLHTAIDELAKLGVLDSPDVEGRPIWMLPDRILIAELRDTTHKARTHWIISGEVPTDHIEAGLADTPRNAARHFSLKWQMHAARNPVAPDQAGGIHDLASQAEALYELVESDEAWD